ncbi:hypothetical protein [Blastococcus sp. TF02A-26]|uniref:hypothetical protein n=1 Tax=Blastococcus sp. TF02A-26 TaxID=2250577 RepID=UPI000DEADDD5|nr:hypothetical protein [Blastococcus sp. TF02A-26]
MRRVALVGISLVLLSTGCTEDDEAAEAAPSEAPPAATEGRPLTFGATHVAVDGLEVTAGEPRSFTPSATAAVPEPPPAHYVVLDLRLENGSSRPVSTSQFVVTLSSGGREQEQVFDTVGGAPGDLAGILPPGSGTEVLLAFGADDPADLELRVHREDGTDPWVFST